MEEGKENLQRAIQQLNTKRAPTDLWDSIEDGLDENEPLDQDYQVLQKAIEQLPHKPFTKDIFDSIISKNQTHQPKRNIAWYKLLVAASVLFLLGMFLITRHEASESVNLTYSEQTIEQAPVTLVAFTDLHTQDEVLSFIKSNCKAFEQQCNQEGFKVLLDEYIQLETDRKELMEAIQHNQEETQLVQYLVRLEKKKTQLGKQLMQTFI